jgi:hypothetical protein
MNRYALNATNDNINEVLQGLKKLNANVFYVGYLKDSFIIMYKSDDYYSLEDCLNIIEDGDK